MVVTYPSGERRIRKNPTDVLLRSAFDELGTHAAVASAFGVSRSVVSRWIREKDVRVISRPEVGAACYLERRITDSEDKLRVAQWLMDEGSVTVTHFKRTNLTSLVVCGSMNDFDVLTSISIVLGAPITCFRSPTPTALPLGGVKVQSAKAFALLRILSGYLVGLKAMEAAAALRYFPPSGTLRGKHTTDEFLVPVWRSYAIQTLTAWSAKRRVKMTEQEILGRAETWIQGRVKRARRFSDRTVAISGQGSLAT